MRGGSDRAERKAEKGAAPVALVSAWQAHWPDVFPPGSDWVPLSGGRTNTVWKVPTARRNFVVKLFSAAGETPLFANDPDAEAVALAALLGTGLAPELAATLGSEVGQSLAYVLVPGRPWGESDDPEPVAQALARLHARPVPTDLPTSPVGPARLVADIRAMDPPGKFPFQPVPDLPESSGPVSRCFLHGDPTAANTLVTSDGITFVDWQCPSNGDPADDLAVFLSPAMQIVSGNPPLSARDEIAFMAAYAGLAPNGPVTVARYQAQAPLYHARMAAYAAWRAARGDAAYEPAIDVEQVRITAARLARPDRMP